MDRVAKASPGDRADLFLRSASLMPQLSPAIIEKDFWVCWVLRRIFSFPALGSHLIFKGGTSLSKAYNAIQRFSEDVDLSIGREYLGAVGDFDPAARGIGKNKIRDRLKGLAQRCEAMVGGELLTQLRADFAAVLGDTGWAVEVDVLDRQTLVFSYPRSATGLALSAGILPAIRLEMGARTDPWPEERREIRPYAAEALPEVFTSPSVDVRVLDARRTFWEKATILHAQSAGDKFRRGYSRHYYDVSRLFRQGIGQEALAQRDLLKRVVEHKRRFFPSGSAGYDTAVPGSLQLLPGEHRAKELRADYDQMRQMIFGNVPPWDEILEDLKQIQAQINAKTE